MLSIIKDNKHQAIRLRRVGLALLGGLFHTIVCVMLWFGGFFRMSLESLIIFFSLVWIVNFIFPTLILTGFNERFKDPSMTIIMVLWSQLVVMASLYFVLEYRTLLLLFAILSIVFSAFRLGFRESILVSSFSVGCYLLVIYFLYENHPTSLAAPLPEWTIGFSYAFIAFCASVVVSELTSTRRHLSDKRLELESSLYILQTHAEIDELTRLKNRRAILNFLEQQRSMTDREPDYHFAIALFDIDLFKEIQDTYGQAIANKVILFFTSQVDFQLRKTDTLARLVNAEFLLVCPFCNIEKSYTLAERVRAKLAEANLNMILPKLSLTVSVGVAEYQRPETIESLLDRASRALLDAKKQGGNQTLSLK